MKRFAVLLCGLMLVLFSAGAVAAESFTFIVSGGKHYRLVKDPAGVPSLIPVILVFVNLDDDPVTPPPPIGTLEQRLQTHKALVKSELEKVQTPTEEKTKIATALATLYRGVAELPATSRDDLTRGTDILWSALRLTAMWTTWKGNVSRSLDTFKSLDEGKRVWLATADALEGK